MIRFSNILGLFFFLKRDKYFINDLKYYKDLVLNLEYKNNLVNITSNAPLSTKYSFKNYFKSKGRAITP